MLTPRLTNCQDCHKIPDLLKQIDCKLAELANDAYNDVVLMLGNCIPAYEINQLLAYKRILTFKYCNPHYAGCVSVNDIAGKVIRLTSGCVSRCNEPTVCEITTCCVDVVPNPTTTTTSTSSTSTTTTTTLVPTTTTTTTINCTFTGDIICPVTTTTTTTAEPTTTTTTIYPGVAPCTWSTYGGNPGEIAVYDFNTNSSTMVLVPNDFTTTSGINRPICSTQDKLWMASVLQENNPSSTIDNVVYIREWDINTSGPSPTLSYVREITIATGSLNTKNIWGTTVSTIAVTSDNNTLLVGFGDVSDGGNSIGVWSWDISNLGDIILTNNNEITYQSVSFSVSSGTFTELTGMFITNDNNVILSARFYENTSPVNAGNYIKQYSGLPPVGGQSIWGDVSSGNPTIWLQQSGVPEFTAGWTDPSKAMPVWGVNGSLQVIQPETLEVYNILQIPEYSATLVTTVADDSVWIHTSNGCANVNIQSVDDVNNCTPTVLPLVIDNQRNYIGPVSFSYSGLIVEASSNNIDGILNVGTSEQRTSDCGITIPEGTVVFNGNASNDLNNPAFDYTLTFPVPVNNIVLRGDIFDTGDNFRITTNSGTPTLQILYGCSATIQNGNEIITDAGLIYGGGSIEVLVTNIQDFTSLTLVGTNLGNGGPWALGCEYDPNTTTTTTTIVSTTTTTTVLPSRVNTIWTWFESEDLPI
jgi:hypothetical protein